MYKIQLNKRSGIYLYITNRHLVLFIGLDVITDVEPF